MDLVSKKRFNNKMRAASVIEISLAITLAVLVIFIALGIFGGNLKTTLSDGNMKNIWHQGYGNVDQSWTKGAQSANLEIELTAELDLIYQQAKSILDALMAKPTLTEQEKRIAALNLTILGVSGPGTFVDNVAPYMDHFGQDAYGGVSFVGRQGITYVSGSPVNWGENNLNFDAYRIGASADDVVKNCNAIRAAFGE